MKKRFFEAVKEEKGMALPIVLVLLLLGGLMIAPTLSYASTSLKTGQIVEENVNGLYAADAGVEYVLWQITNDIEPDEEQQLPGGTINQMAVSIETEDRGIYTLYAGELIVVDENPQGQEHYKWLAVDGEIVWDDEAQAYKYEITVIWQPADGEQGGGNCNLVEVGVRLPVGYSYQTGSATGLSTGDPDTIEQDGAGAYLLNWELPGGPELMGAQTVTQTFYIIGEGSQDGDYTWVDAVRNDVGAVGEFIGAMYSIRAEAPVSDPTAIIMVDAIWNEQAEEITIISWQINPQ